LKIVKARVCGYCMGVRRAMETTIEEACSAAEPSSVDGRSSVYTMGPLIHNASALESLARLGVSVLEEAALPTSLEGATVIIRAHGVPPALTEELKSRGGRVVDATCPRVRLSQKRARTFSEKGYTVFLAGEKNHGEITGIAAYALDCRLVASVEEARSAAASLLAQNQKAKTALIGQTTITEDEYSSVAEELKKFFPNLEIADSICPATKDRLAALHELCEEADAIIVVGGKNSANTRRLFTTALEHGKPSWHIETADEVLPELASYAVVGLSAGASTPDEVIKSVEEKLLSLPLIAQDSTIR